MNYIEILLFIIFFVSLLSYSFSLSRFDFLKSKRLHISLKVVMGITSLFLISSSDDISQIAYSLNLFSRSFGLEFVVGQYEKFLVFICTIVHIVSDPLFKNKKSTIRHQFVFFVSVLLCLVNSFPMFFFLFEVLTVIGISVALGSYGIKKGSTLSFIINSIGTILLLACFSYLASVLDFNGVFLDIDKDVLSSLPYFGFLSPRGLVSFIFFLYLLINSGILHLFTKKNLLLENQQIYFYWYYVLIGVVALSYRFLGNLLTFSHDNQFATDHLVNYTFLILFIFIIYLINRFKTKNFAAIYLGLSSSVIFLLTFLKSIGLDVLLNYILCSLIFFTFLNFTQNLKREGFIPKYNFIKIFIFALLSLQFLFLPLSFFTPGMKLFMTEVLRMGPIFLLLIGGIYSMISSLFIQEFKGYIFKHNREESYSVESICLFSVFLLLFTLLGLKPFFFWNLG